MDEEDEAPPAPERLRANRSRFVFVPPVGISPRFKLEFEPLKINDG